MTRFWPNWRATTSFFGGRELALSLRPSSEEWEVRARLQETTEAKSLLATRADVSVGGAHDVRPLMRRAEIGSPLQPTELLDIRNTLSSARTLRTLLLHLADQVPLLAAKAELLDPLPEVIQEIGRCLDDDGNVLDEASPALARIRHESAIARDRLYERLRRMVTSSDTARYLQETIITQRNGRYVIRSRPNSGGASPASFTISRPAGPRCSSSRWRRWNSITAGTNCNWPSSARSSGFWPN